VGYKHAKTMHDYWLYIRAKSESEREEWMQLLRNLCRQNANLADTYHPSQWSGGRWLCCGSAVRAGGCQEITWSPPDRGDVSSTSSGGAGGAKAAVLAAAKSEPPDEMERVVEANGVKARIVIAVYPFEAIEPGDLVYDEIEFS
jgi:hypothetical protein